MNCVWSTRILPPEIFSLPDALSRIKDKTGQKFIVIVDEWDVLIRDEAANKKHRKITSYKKGKNPVSTE